MSKRFRLCLFISFLAVYLVLSPVLVFYALGYRIDFSSMRIITTGGIYMKVWPQQLEVFVDQKLKAQTSRFSDELLIQGLSPKKYDIQARKDGYYTWEKELEVKEKEVNRVESVTLIKKDIAFEEVHSLVQDFYVSPNESYALIVYQKNLVILSLSNKQKIGGFSIPNKEQNLKATWSNDSKKILLESDDQYFIYDTEKPKTVLLPIDFGRIVPDNVDFLPGNSNILLILGNNTLYTFNKEDATLLLDDVFVYRGFQGTWNNKIFWLSTNGILYELTTGSNSQAILTETPFLTNKDNDYELIVENADLVFLKENKRLFLLNKDNKELELFYESVNSVRLSPEKDKLLYISNNELSFSYLNEIEKKKFLFNFSEPIEDCYWLNNSYLVFNIAGQIEISEIDTRDRINAVELPKNISLTDGASIALNNPRIYFNQRDKKLYILNENELLASERLSQ